MENTSLPNDVWNNLTTSSSKYEQTLNLYGPEPAVKVINSVIAVVGILDNMFVIITFALFIKITDKVLTILRYYTTLLIILKSKKVLMVKIIFTIRRKIHCYGGR